MLVLQHLVVELLIVPGFPDLVKRMSGMFYTECQMNYYDVTMYPDYFSILEDFV